MQWAMITETVNFLLSLQNNKHTGSGNYVNRHWKPSDSKQKNTLMTYGITSYSSSAETPIQTQWPNIHALSRYNQKKLKQNELFLYKK